MQSAHVDASERSEAKQPELSHRTAKEPDPAHQSAEPIFARLRAWPARSEPVGPPPLPRPFVAPEMAVAQAPAARSPDSELPIAQSVEPMRTSNGSRAGIAPTLPVLVDQVRRTTERVSGGVRALVARSPRVAMVIALTVVVLLGVVIGYAAANKSTDATTSGEEGGQLENRRLPTGAGGSGDSLRAGASRRDSASRRATSASPRRTSGVRRPGRSGSRGGAAAAVTTEPAASEPSPPDSAAPPEVSRPVAEGSTGASAAGPSRDSAAIRTTPAASEARTDSLAAEREALRLELQRRQARLDSLARRVQELKPDQR
jgi:hypothetical protein